MNKLILKIIDKLSFIYTKNGVNYPAMRKILELKLTLDSRRNTTIFNNSNVKQSKEKNLFLYSLLYYVFFGLFLGLFMSIQILIFTNIGLFFTSNIVFLFFILISDFSTILLDTLDKKIFLTKPIDTKTYNSAKLTHIFIYLFLIIASINLTTIIVGSIIYGVLFLLLYLFQLLLITMLAIFITSFLYFIILKYFDGEKLKDIINIFQIIFTIFIMIGYQILIRSFSFIESNAGTSPKLWLYFLPSYWFAAPYKLIYDGYNNSSPFIILTIVSIIVPIFLFFFYLNIISSKFEYYMIKLDNESSIKKDKINAKFSLVNKLLKIVCRSNEERIFARFGMKQFNKERKLKLSIYPNLALGIILPFLFTFNDIDFNKFSLNSLRVQLQDSKTYFWIYYAVLLYSTIIHFYKFSENPEGAWIYNTLPIKDMSAIFKGIYKSFVIKFIIPTYLLLSLFYIFIFGVRILFDLTICFAVIIFMSMLFFKLNNLELPFSLQLNQIKENKNTGNVFLALLIIGIIVAIHIAVNEILIAKLVMFLVAIICCIITYLNFAHN